MTRQQTNGKARSQKRQRPAVAGARLTDDEMNRLREVAKRHGQSVSNYVRTVLQRDLEKTA